MAQRPSKKPTLLLEHEILDQHPPSESKVSKPDESTFIGPSPEVVVSSSLIAESPKPDPIDEMEAELNDILPPPARDPRLIFEERYDLISANLKDILTQIENAPKLLPQDWPLGSRVPNQRLAAQSGLPKAQLGSGNQK